jgi:hypothetical protein
MRTGRAGRDRGIEFKGSETGPRPPRKSGRCSKASIGRGHRSCAGRPRLGVGAGGNCENMRPNRALCSAAGADHAPPAPAGQQTAAMQSLPAHVAAGEGPLDREGSGLMTRRAWENDET